MDPEFSVLMGTGMICLVKQDPYTPSFTDQCQERQVTLADTILTEDRNYDLILDTKPDCSVGRVTLALSSEPIPWMHILETTV